jgi:serine/threonine protein kinase
VRFLLLASIAMIAFSCPQCGMKFQVKDEFAGRTTRCPTCKNALVVPPPVAAPATVMAPVHVGLAGGSISQAAGGSGVTLEVKQRVGDHTIDPCSVKNVLAGQLNQGNRYVVTGEIARGGMGMVLRAVDSDIRREVALKFLLDQSNPNKTLRFIAEAQITGQLEHPNIVPVHELGTNNQKQVFFSMKMVRGRSLLQILDDLRAKDIAAEKRFTLGKLLNVLVSVCNALAYAHTFGVVHRDIKPANIMVGDFGEVYVMDWGLAKLLQGNEEPMGESEQFAASLNAANEPSNEVGPGGSSKVVTSRQPETELTMEGTIMGTPSYMPPEQARGQLRAIGPRSDIYSMGAILYEMLALEPPVDRNGGFYAVLQRVVLGEIAPPEKRFPARAKEGKIPSELSAIAMKALAKDPARRYGSAEALRRDIELFQEGRSVSAKEDTKTELAIKFVKRNRTLCAAAGMLALILIGTSLISLRAALAAQKAYADVKRAQEERQERTLQALPALVEAARFGIERRRFDSALAQAKLAIDYDPDQADALLLHGQLLIGVRKDFKAALKDLDRYLKNRPNDKMAAELRALCARSDAGEPGNLLRFAQIFIDQQVPTLGEKLMKDYGGNTAGAREILLEPYRKRIDIAWKGLGAKLTLDNNPGIFALDLTAAKQVVVLTPLEGFPLTRLSLDNCTSVRDLAPLKGMPLTNLRMNNCNLVSDLSPLQGMPLETLVLSGCAVRDLTPIKDCPLQTLNLSGCAQIHDLAPLQGMKLTSLDLSGCGIDNLADLKGMPLSTIGMSKCPNVRDLTPLKGMKLTTLNLANCAAIEDLTPLAAMKLTSLTLDNCAKVRDLAPLKEMPLTTLSLAGCKGVADVTPLAGLKLTTIKLPPQQVQGMDVLRKMTSLTTINGQTVEAFWKKYDDKGK